MKVNLLSGTKLYKSEALVQDFVTCTGKYLFIKLMYFGNRMSLQGIKAETERGEWSLCHHPQGGWWR